MKFELFVVLNLVFSFLLTKALGVIPKIGEKCTTYCVEGQRCDGDRCVTCENGTFQDIFDSHQNPSCKPWTPKPTGRGWEIKVKGSTTSDQEWGCISGYRVKLLSPQERRCIRDQVVPVTESPAQNKTTLTTLTTPTAASGKNESSAGLSTHWIILIVVGIIIVIAAVLCFKYREKIKKLLGCKKRDRTRETEPADSNGSSMAYQMSPASPVEPEDIIIESQPLVNSASNGHAGLKSTFEEFSARLVRDMDPVDMKQLFMRLQKPHFNPLSKFKYKRDARPNDSEEPCIETLIEWREANPNESIDKITEILVDLKRTDIIEEDWYIRLFKTLKENENDSFSRASTSV